MKLYIQNMAHRYQEIELALRNEASIISAKIHPNGELDLECESLAKAVDAIKNACPDAKISFDSIQDSFSHQKILWILLFFLLGLGLHFVENLAKFSYAFLFASYAIAAWEMLCHVFHAFKNKSFFDENTLMLFSSLAAFGLGAYIEGVSVVVLYTLGEHLQDFALFKSKKSYFKLADSMPSEVCVLENGDKIQKPVSQVQAGEQIVLSAGDKIALDVRILQGEGYVDRRAISGESVPLFFRAGDELKSGSVMLDSSALAVVTKSMTQSHLFQVHALMQEALEKKGRIEGFLKHFARFYTPLVFGFALLVFLLGFGLSGEAKEWFYRALVVLMVSCPCALMLSIPLGYCAALGACSKKGILLKKAEIFDEVLRVDCVLFDKTGTLTQGKLQLKDIHSQQTQKLLLCAKSALMGSKHLIAKAIVQAIQDTIKPLSISSHKELAGKGMIAQSPMGEILAGSQRLMQEYNIDFQPYKGTGMPVYVACDREFLGTLICEDEVREDSIWLISLLKALKKKVCILSGDREENVKALAQSLGCEYQANMLPEQKYQAISNYQKDARALMFVGDGINDAPAISKADIGVSMGIGGSDLARNSADVILTRDEIGAVGRLFKLSKSLRAILWQNVLLVLVVKGIFIILGILGLADIWEAIFGDVGVSLIAVLNALRLFGK